MNDDNLTNKAKLYLIAIIKVGEKKCNQSWKQTL